MRFLPIDTYPTRGARDLQFYAILTCAGDVMLASIGIVRS